MLLLEEKRIKREQAEKKILKLNFDSGNDKKYKIDIINKNTIYASKINSHLLCFYFVIA